MCPGGTLLTGHCRALGFPPWESVQGGVWRRVPSWKPRITVVFTEDGLTEVRHSQGSQSEAMVRESAQIKLRALELQAVRQVLVVWRLVLLSRPPFLPYWSQKQVSIYRQIQAQILVQISLEYKCVLSLEPLQHPLQIDSLKCSLLITSMSCDPRIVDHP